MRAREASLDSIRRWVISLGSARGCAGAASRCPCLTLGTEASPEGRSQAEALSVCPLPCLQHSDMPEEMRVETMELCVTACEKFSNNNEVLPSVQAAPRVSGDPCGPSPHSQLQRVLLGPG